MSIDPQCPECSSANVICSKKRGVSICEDCGHVLTDAPVSPLRIFLSYGHDANEELCQEADDTQFPGGLTHQRCNHKPAQGNALGFS